MFGPRFCFILAALFAAAGAAPPAQSDSRGFERHTFRPMAGSGHWLTLSPFAAAVEAGIPLRTVAAFGPSVEIVVSDHAGPALLAECHPARVYSGRSTEPSAGLFLSMAPLPGDPPSGLGFNPLSWVLVFFPRETSDLYHARVNWEWSVDGRPVAGGVSLLARKRFPYLVESDYQMGLDPAVLLPPLAGAAEARLVVDGPRLRFRASYAVGEQAAAFVGACVDAEAFDRGAG